MRGVTVVVEFPEPPMDLKVEKRMDSGSFLRHVLFIVYLKEGIHVGILDFQKKWKDSYKKELQNLGASVHP